MKEDETPLIRHLEAFTTKKYGLRDLLKHSTDQDRGRTGAVLIAYAKRIIDLDNDIETQIAVTYRIQLPLPRECLQACLIHQFRRVVLKVQRRGKINRGGKTHRCSRVVLIYHRAGIRRAGCCCVIGNCSEHTGSLFVFGLLANECWSSQGTSSTGLRCVRVAASFNRDRLYPTDGRYT
jgi:hypothetical protein